MMEKIDKILIEKHYFFNSGNLFWKRKKAYRVYFKIKLLDNNKVKIHKFRLYFDKIYIKCYKLILDLDDLLYNIENYIEDKYDSFDLSNYNIYHCELSCNKCELYIRNNLVYENFYRFEGFIGIHGIYEGKCILAIDEKSSIKIYKYLDTFTNCDECRISIYNEIYDSE